MFKIFVASVLAMSILAAGCGKKEEETQKTTTTVKTETKVKGNPTMTPTAP